MGDCLKSTLHMKVPASKRCTPVTLRTAGEAEARKWARSPKAVGSDHRSGRDDSDDDGFVPPPAAASLSLCSRES